MLFSVYGFRNEWKYLLPLDQVLYTRAFSNPGCISSRQAVSLPLHTCKKKKIRMLNEFNGLLEAVWAAWGMSPLKVTGKGAKGG